MSCGNSLIRNKLSFGGRGEAYGEGGGGKEKDLQSTVEAAFFPVVSTILNKLLSAMPLVFVTYFQILTDAELF